jgi:hypothetical protein
VKFDVVSPIEAIEVIAVGTNIRNLAYLQMNTPKRQFAVCVDNTGYEASLIVRRIYEVLPDEEVAKDELLRVVDESGEDYLYHRSQFILIEFPAEVERALTTA